MQDKAEYTDDGADAALDPRRVDRILEALEDGNTDRLSEQLAPLHPADIADFLEQIDSGKRSAFLRLWDGDAVGDVLSELDEGLREEVIGQLDPATLQAAVRELDTDDVVDLVEDLEDDQKAAILDALEMADRFAVEQALGYPEYTAGRLMQREVVTAPEDWTVGRMIDFLRDNEDLPDQFYHVILVDPRMSPVGNVTLGRVLSARRSVPLADLTEESFFPIRATEPVENVAYAFNQYHLISTPVVDDSGRLVGVITIDDAMIVLSDEHEEDYLKLAGVGDTSITDRVWTTAKSRFPWLLINLVTANVAAQVIAQFENTIEQIVLLAILMPIVASMGGNAGTQSLAVAVRAIATKDLTSANALRFVRREAAVGLLNGLAFALIMGLVVAVGFGQPLIGLVIGAAIWLTLIGAAVGGVMIPLTLERIGVDPAVASGPFVTTITDIVGFFVFLGIATLVLL